MSIDAVPAPSTRGGLAVLSDVIVAPRAAFAALRERHTWGWAFAVVGVLGIAGAYLQLPAGEHVVHYAYMVNPRHDPRIAALPPTSREHIIAITDLWQTVATFLYPVGALIAMLYGALICLAASAAGRGDATYGRLFAFVANVAAVRLGVGAFVTGLLTALRGPTAFSSARDLLTVLPSLAWLAPAGNAKIAAFLTLFNPFQIWTFVLVAIGLPIVARIGRTPALVAAAVLVLTETAISVATAT